MKKYVLGIIAGCILAGCLIIGYVKGITPFAQESSEDWQAPSKNGENDMEGALDGFEGAIEPAKQASELGDSWNSYTFQINDKVIALPCEYKELEMAGLTIDEALGIDNNGIVTGAGYLIGYLTDGKGNSMTVEFINPDKTEKKAEECLVGRISIGNNDLEAGGMTVVFPGGIQIGDTKESVIAKYGEPEEKYEEGNPHVCIWSDSDMLLSPVEADFDSQSGKLIQMSIENYQNEQK